MALRGSLADLGVVEAIQVPAAGRKTGLLILASPLTEARLYYADGRLVHAEMERLEGQAVLVEVVGWSEGEFEFRPDVTCAAVTVEVDLGRAIMLALKERDEHEAGAAPAAPPADPVMAELVRQALVEAVAANDVLLWASVQRADGSVAASTANGLGVPAGLEELRHAVSDLTRSYPRPSLRRVLVEDELGTVIVSALRSGSSLMVAAGKQAKLGSVSMIVDRLVRRLDEAT